MYLFSALIIYLLLALNSETVLVEEYPGLEKVEAPTFFFRNLVTPALCCWASMKFLGP